MAESADLMDAIITQSEGQYSVEPEDAGAATRDGELPAHIADYLFYKTWDTAPGTLRHCMTSVFETKQPERND